MLTTEFKSFIYQESECQLNQNLSRQIKGPSAPPPSFCQRLCFALCSQCCLEAVAAGWVWPRPYMSHYPARKVVHHLYIKSMGGVVEGVGQKEAKTNWLIAKPAMMSATINVSHRHANQRHDIITASITPVGLQSYSKDNITQHFKPQETSTPLSDVL